ncbi:membrane-spanning 4-domains subfamily A member 4D-like isoform X2 [Hyperolius riggenbachi]|uniref:membrane-spanning 4-domains subfamily A member 4D-like isoform X2 n=1 Tax=Hyperolius riggenbachi TaxID=752182 RepID=UPI0035A315CB
MSTAKADLRNTDDIPEANTQVIQFGLPDGRLVQNVSSDLPKPLHKFYQGEPEALGATQVFSAVLILCLGIVITILDGYYGRELLHTGVTYWSGILFLICGSVSVSASVKPTLGKAAIYGILAILLVFTMLFFCIAITTAVYGCKTVCRTSYNEINIVLYQTTAPSVPQATAEVASVPTAPISSSEG